MGTAMLKLRFIGREMSMEFRHPEKGIVRTSRVREIKEVMLSDSEQASSAAQQTFNRRN